MNAFACCARFRRYDFIVQLNKIAVSRCTIYEGEGFAFIGHVDNLSDEYV
jgi:hypothetical protein